MIINKELAMSKGVDQKDLWETPQHIFKKLDKEFDFDLDPCCTKETAKCEYFYTPEDDGLKRSWKGLTVFCNPPYSRGNIDLWVKKCYEESLYDETIVVALLPVSTSADWWHKNIVGKASLRFVERRIRFVGAPYTAPFSSVIVIWGGNSIESFSQTVNAAELKSVSSR
jgi:site-specific DNA-methyltransferase (adenine-specific)